MKFSALFLFFILCGFGYSQQTIVFQKKKNSKRTITYNLPAYVTVYTRSDVRYQGLLTSYSDSSITVCLPYNYYSPKDTAFIHKLLKVEGDKSIPKKERKAKYMHMVFFDSVTIPFRTIDRICISGFESKQGKAKNVIAAAMLIIGDGIFIALGSSENSQPPTINLGWAILGALNYDFLLYHLFIRNISPDKWEIRSKPL